MRQAQWIWLHGVRLGRLAGTTQDGRLAMGVAGRSDIVQPVEHPDVAVGGLDDPQQAGVGRVDIIRAGREHGTDNC